MRKHTVAMAFSAVLIAAGASAQTTLDCTTVATALATLDGYAVTIPPAGPDQGWCVLDGASFRSQTPGWPNLDATRLRLRQTETGTGTGTGTGTEIDLDLAGLTAEPRPFDREVDERLRSLLRLQSADLRLRAVHHPQAGVLSLSGFQLDLSGGTRLTLDADIKGADLSPAALATGVVTRVRLVWRSDGKLLRPALELAGENISGATGPAAVDAARMALADGVDALPGAALDDASRTELAAAVAALPQGRGQLTLTFQSEVGIGAARIALATLSGDPLAPEALAKLLDKLLDKATITADWQPGLAP